MQVGLVIPCYMASSTREVGIATMELLEHLDVEVDYCRLPSRFERDHTQSNGPPHGLGKGMKGGSFPLSCFLLQPLSGPHKYLG